MFSKLVVPLDGSKLAEAALPYAVRVADLTEARLLLVQVIEMPPLLEGSLNAEDALLESSESYLKQVKETITNPDLALHLPVDKVQTCVSYGTASHEIAKIAELEKAGLIVMTTHGRSGLSRLFLGSVATSTVQHTSIPVLMLKPTREKTSFETLEALLNASDKPGWMEGRHCRILVTLDNPEEASLVLQPAIKLASQLNATIYLLHVVHPYIPVSTVEPWIEGHLNIAPELINVEAHNYLLKAADEQLAGIQSEVEAQEVKCVKALREGEPALEIESYVNMIQPDMLVMATHARGIVGRALLGSVTEAVLRQTHLPVLLVHLTRSAGKEESASDKPELKAGESPKEEISAKVEPATKAETTSLANAPESSLIEVAAPGTLMSVDEVEKSLSTLHELVTH